MLALPDATDTASSVTSATRSRAARVRVVQGKTCDRGRIGTNCEGRAFAKAHGRKVYSIVSSE